jgi:hypothetical protein
MQSLLNKRNFPDIHPKIPNFGFALSAVNLQFSAKVLQFNQLADG